MNTTLLNRKEQTLITTEIKQFFLHRRSLHLIPLMMAGVLLAFWPYFSSPFVPVILVLFAWLEPQFNNILFRTPLELESLSVLPLEWERIIRAKNIATIFLVLVMFPVVAATILYFSPTVVTSEQTGKAALYILTVLFPLIHVGNMRSVQHPRRETGWQFDDIAGIAELLISVAILSISFLIFTEMLNAPALCVVYFVATLIFWSRYSIPKTAELIEASKTDICMNV